MLHALISTVPDHNPTVAIPGQRLFFNPQKKKSHCLNLEPCRVLLGSARLVSPAAASCLYICMYRPVYVVRALAWFGKCRTMTDAIQDRRKGPEFDVHGILGRESDWLLVGFEACSEVCFISLEMRLCGGQTASRVRPLMLVVYFCMETDTPTAQGRETTQRATGRGWVVEGYEYVVRFHLSLQR